jgi:hypothetical protein
MMTGQSYVEVVKEFERELTSDNICRPELATHLALTAKNFGDANGLGEDGVIGIVVGAAAMYQALRGGDRLRRSRGDCRSDSDDA